MKITLSQPLKYRDGELSELELDLDGLTGGDIISVEDGMRAKGQRVDMVSQAYFAAVAARAAHIPAEALNSLKLHDFLRVTTEVVDFLNSAGSSALKQESSDA